MCPPDAKTKELHGDKMGEFREWFQQRLDDAIKASEAGRAPGDPGETGPVGRLRSAGSRAGV